MTQDAAAQELAAALGRRMGELYEEQDTLADSTRVALRMHEAATEMCKAALESARAEGQRQGRAEAYQDAIQMLIKVVNDHWFDGNEMQHINPVISELERLAQAIQEAK